MLLLWIYFVNNNFSLFQIKKFKSTITSCKTYFSFPFAIELPKYLHLLGINLIVLQMIKNSKNVFFEWSKLEEMLLSVYVRPIAATATPLREFASIPYLNISGAAERIMVQSPLNRWPLAFCHRPEKRKRVRQVRSDGFRLKPVVPAPSLRGVQVTPHMIMQMSTSSTRCFIFRSSP